MTLFYVFCISAPIALLLSTLVRTGDSSSVKEAMQRNIVGTKQAAPIAPRIKFAPEADSLAPVTRMVPSETTEPAAGSLAA